MSGVKIVEQSGKGKGLVATQKFKRGDIVAIYATKPLPAGNLTVADFKYAFEYNETMAFLGDHKEFGGIGRYANDPMPTAMYERLSKCTTVAAIMRWYHDYNIATIQNLGTVRPIRSGESLNLVALDDIDIGADITFPYTAMYWLNEIVLISMASSRTRLACCLAIMLSGYTPIIITDPFFPYFAKNGARCCGTVTQKSFPDDATFEFHIARLQEFLGYEERGIEHWIAEHKACWADPVEIKSPICACCQRPGPKKVCGKCKTSYYCGRECQVKHWPHHRKVCKISSILPSTT